MADAAAPTEAAPPAGRHRTVMAVTLAQLLERQTPVAWFESVAIVQALCAALIDQGGERASVPELRDIAITPEGHVELLADGPAGQSAVHRAGRVLTALVDQQQMPVPLRLLALTAVSPEPTYTSLRDLSTALDYFERPDRSKVVAEVFARYEQMPAPAPGVEVPALPVLEESPKPKRAAVAWWRRRSVVAAGIAGAFVLVAIPLAWWLWDRPEGSWLRASSQQVSRAVTAAADTVVSVAGSGVRAVKERLGATPAAGPAPDVVAEVPTSGTRSHGLRRVPVLPSKPLAAFTYKPGQSRAGQAIVPTLFQPAPPDPWQAVPLFPWSDPFLVVAVPAPATSALEDPTIYTAADASVVPPELVRPRLPKSPPPGVRLQDLPRLELVVSPTGEVESVKLMSPGAGVHPAMMLSAVKNWRFQPAMRAGVPVRYRHHLWLTR